MEGGLAGSRSCSDENHSNSFQPQQSRCHPSAGSTHRRHLHPNAACWESGRASFDASSPFGSRFHEELPIHDALCISDKSRYRQLLRRTRNTKQFQTGFVRQAVALFRVHNLVRPDKISPFVLAATRSRNNVVQAALLLAKQFARV